MAKSSKTFGVSFDGFLEMAARLDKLDGSLKETVADCLEVIPGIVDPGLHAAMAAHHRTGKTEQTIVENPKATWDGTRGTIEVGFDISAGGLPSVFLMYGTAKHAPTNQYGTPKKAGAKMIGMNADKKLYDAIFGKQVQAQISEKQKAIFEAAIKKAQGG